MEDNVASAQVESMPEVRTSFEPQKITATTNTTAAAVHR